MELQIRKQAIMHAICKNANEKECKSQATMCTMLPSKEAKNTMNKRTRKKAGKQASKGIAKSMHYKTGKETQGGARSQTKRARKQASITRMYLINKAGKHASKFQDCL